MKMLNPESREAVAMAQLIWTYCGLLVRFGVPTELVSPIVAWLPQSFRLCESCGRLSRANHTHCGDPMCGGNLFDRRVAP